MSVSPLVAPPDRSRPERLVAGRYRLLARAGAGTSGQVFLAEDTVLHRSVAIKVLHPALASDQVFLDRFQAEARTAAGLTHPNLVVVHDQGYDGGPFQVSEFCSGGSLRALLDHNGLLSLSQALAIGLEATKGLEYAHRRGFVHRDIKPANLLFDDEGRLRIADFGLAKALAEASVTEPNGSVTGTARYASPEQAKGQRLDGKSDVYSLALVLVEAVTGALPFSADTPLGLLMARTEGSVQLGAELGALRAPLERALRLDPAERPDAGELRLHLLGAAEKLPRPEPLPLAEFDITAPHLVGSSVDPDPTAIAPTTAGAPGNGSVPASANTATKGSTMGSVDAPAKTTSAVAPPPSVAPAGPMRRRLRRAGAVLLLLAIVGATAAGGWYWWDSSRVASRPVPALVGTPVAELAGVVGDFWLIDEKADRQDGSEVGEILRTVPEAGASLDEGETITVFVSLGSALRTVPVEDLLGVSLVDARGILEGLDLGIGQVTPIADEEQPEGTVLRVLSTELQLAAGGLVDVEVSSGPAPRPVPADLVGLPYEEAAALIEAVRLVPSRSDAYDAEVPVGAVVSVSPEPGTQLAVGGTVTVVVSKGPEPVTIPEVEGMNVLDAAAALRNAGLCIGDTEGPADGAVLTTDPPAGQVVPVGSCVRIITSEFG